jgi:hypothetical protein
MNPLSPEYKATVLQTGPVRPVADIYSGKLLDILFPVAKFQLYSKLIEMCLKSNSYMNFILT